MNRLIYYSLLPLLCSISHNCTGQHPKMDVDKNLLSQDFDQSPPIYYKMPAQLLPTDTSPGYSQEGQKILLTGKAYKRDGQTPAANTILYYYHTNINGKYATKPSEVSNMPKNKLGQTHGYIRGWVKTGKDGKYSIFTVMPGTYPNRSEPAHIHMYVKEEGETPAYYIDDFVFDNDPLLTTSKRLKMEERGGNGVIRFVEINGLWVGERNIFLGSNIEENLMTPDSAFSTGNAIGEAIYSFTPYHAYGPDKGTQTCPICKYGWYHGILYFVGNRPNWSNIKKWLLFLDKESILRKEHLKVYFVYGNERNYHKNERILQLEKLGNQIQLQSVALTFVPSFSDTLSKIHLNRINPDVNNTMIVYKRSIIIGKFINLLPDQANFNTIQELLNKSSNQYFKLRPVRPK